MLTVQERLYREFTRARPRMSVGQLRERTGLAMDRSSMSRKIRGALPMTLEEASRVADVLGLRIQAVRKRAA